MARVTKVVALGLAAVVFLPGAAAEGDTLGPANIVGAVRQVSRGIVVVEYWLRYDKGQRPELPLDDESGEAAGGRDADDDLVREERPFEKPGFLVAPHRVVTSDLALHERFIQSIRVSYGGRSVPARIHAYALDRSAVVLALEDTLPGARVIEFDSAAALPFVAVRSVRHDGRWRVAAAPWSESGVLVGESLAVVTPPLALVVDRHGRAAGLVMDREAAAGTWRGAPLSWPVCSRTQRDEAVKRLRDVAESCLAHVKLSFRSPKLGGGRQFEEQRRNFWRPETMSATEVHAVGVCLENGRVLVLAELSAEATSRLERIEVYDPSGVAREAVFTATLRDYGALVVTLATPLPVAIRLTDSSLAALRHRLLLRARVSVAGKQRIAFYWHGRMRRLEQGYRRALYPVCDRDDRHVFLFTLSGRLAALPLTLRHKTVGGQPDGYYAESMSLAPVELLRNVLDDLRGHSDTSNVPLSEEQEGRIAWLGVVLQPLDRELARAYGVAEQTGDGESGALISYVYESSPAAKAGIQPGMILLRVNPDGFPKPVNVRLEGQAWDEPFLWEDLDNLPEDMIERMPPPWPTADDAFSRFLTELGFGRRFRADFVHKGVEFSREFTVTESPVHYGVARKYRDERLGLTVRDLTFEVRRHYRKGPADPGVIVSRVETGSRASVAGIKPYELITHLNGRAVESVKEFERLATRSDEVRLSVERMGRSRQVRIRLAEREEKKR